AEPRLSATTHPHETRKVPKKRGTKQGSNGNGGNLGFEQKLWQAADKMRGHMDASEYKHVALGLIFLKYISDAFEETHRLITAGEDDLAKQYGPGDPEDRTEYEARNVVWVPPESRWPYIQKNGKQSNIGRLIDDAMVAIERDNPSFKGVMPKSYNSRDLDRHRLGELIDLISTITLTEAGNNASRSRDILGRVYEYFLGRFAEREGKSGGEFYTPQSVVKLLVEMIEPFKGRVFDPCCGSGGMFVQSEKFVKEHGGRIGDIAVYGQESNPTTWKLARLNLAIRAIDANLGPQHADSFHRDLHPDLKADYILANPPFNMSDWGGERLREDKRWQFGTPPAGNANYAWVQHFIHHLAPTGTAGFVMANGSMSSNQSGEGEIRQRIVEADMVDCMIAMPGQHFYTTGIPVCLWFLTRDKKNHRFRDRRGQTLFIDARQMGALIDRTHRELSDEEIARIARTYHAWRGEKEAGGLDAYEDVPGFCKSASLDEIKSHGHVLTPGRYVGAAEVEDDGEPFEEKMPKLVAQLEEQFAESARLEQKIRANLEGLGYGG
ncbi:MAG: class I SAM-dependent DNA methyltransferase, partial [Pirellulales bacterium]